MCPEYTQPHTHTDGTDSIPSTADAGENKEWWSYLNHFKVLRFGFIKCAEKINPWEDLQPTFDPHVLVNMRFISKFCTTLAMTSGKVSPIMMQDLEELSLSHLSLNCLLRHCGLWASGYYYRIPWQQFLPLLYQSASNPVMYWWHSNCDPTRWHTITPPSIISWFAVLLSTLPRWCYISSIGQWTDFQSAVLVRDRGLFYCDNVVYTLTKGSMSRLFSVC